MLFANRVAVHNCIGRRIFTAHRELAAAMVAELLADYQDAKTIVLVQVVRMTDEMRRPRIIKFRIPHAESSSGDAGRGNVSVPRYQALHYQGDAGYRTSAAQ